MFYENLIRYAPLVPCGWTAMAINTQLRVLCAFARTIRLDGIGRQA